MPLDAVFLDLGNTLLVERVPRAALYADEARHFGLRVGAAAMEEHMSRALAEMPAVVAGDFRFSDGWFRAFQRRIFLDELGLDPGSFEGLSQRLFARFEDAGTFRLYPGAHELLAALRGRGLSVGLVSNWSARLGRLLAAVGLHGSFDFVLCSAEMRMEKPDPGLFEEAARRAGAPPERCLHAGDHVERDARGALRAGLAAVLVDHEGRLGVAERGTGDRAPCPIVGSLPELQDLILDRVP